MGPRPVHPTPFQSRFHHDFIGTFHAAAANRIPLRSKRLHLLQGYDEYIMGYSESKYVLDMSGAGRAGFQDRASYVGVVILDGQVAGRWKKAERKGSLLIQVDLHARFNSAQTRALHLAADKLADFVGLTAIVEVS